ncbi:MAG: hypothetical protein RIB98_14830 [Acidimicrobiales bacterium]
MISPIRQVANRRPELRRSLPATWGDEPLVRSKIAAELKELWVLIEEDADVELQLEFELADLVATRQPIVPGQRRQLAAAQNIAATTTLRIRDTAIAVIEERDDDAVVHCYGAEVTFPIRSVATLRRALSGEAVTVADLSGDLDTDGCIVLARRLVREGILAIE